MRKPDAAEPSNPTPVATQEQTIESAFSGALLAMKRIALDDMVLALGDYLEYHGAIHDDGCPEDDTCSCSFKRINDGVNMAYKFIGAMANQAACVEGSTQRSSVLNPERQRKDHPPTSVTGGRR